MAEPYGSTMNALAKPWTSVPADRATAWRRLEAFSAQMPKYAAQRNRVISGHANVSQLSPAVRHRLLPEEAFAAYAIEQHGFRSVEKLVQEIYWRLYWKSWLEMRPSVWSRYRHDLSTFGSGTWRAGEKVMDGHSGIEIIDHFARELTTTGYLHNHARMWFAGAWIHHFGLPWQMGAEFFHQHLLDGDPASNTLSWRWVAGLHTPGKTYLARKANIEKYVERELLDQNRGGLDELTGTTEKIPHDDPNPDRQPPWVETWSGDHTSETVGWWIHEDDLSMDEPFEVAASVALLSHDHEEAFGYREDRSRFIEAGLRDAGSRVGAEFAESNNTAVFLVEWAKQNGLKAIVAYQPWVGPTRDALPNIEQTLRDHDITLHVHRKQSDRWWLDQATAGFFGFWKKVCRHHGFETK